MKTILRTVTLIALLGAITLPLSAIPGDRPGPRGQFGGPGQRGPVGGPDRPVFGDFANLSEEERELIVLGRLLRMSPEELDNLAAAIDKVRAMDEAEKAAVVEKLEDLRSEKRAQMQERRKAWESVPPEERREIAEAMRSLPPEERRTLMQELRDLPPEERLARIREVTGN